MSLPKTFQVFRSIMKQYDATTLSQMLNRKKESKTFQFHFDIVVNGVEWRRFCQKVKERKCSHLQRQKILVNEYERAFILDLKQKPQKVCHSVSLLFRCNEMILFSFLSSSLIKNISPLFDESVTSNLEYKESFNFLSCSKKRRERIFHRKENHKQKSVQF